MPERGDWRASAAVIPHAGGDNASRSDDPAHLAQPRYWVLHEMNDELGERRIEAIAVERELLGAGLLHLDIRVALTVGLHEQCRRIDGGNVISAEHADETRRQRPRTGADVERRLAGAHVGELEHRCHELHRVATDQPVVRIRGDVEGHEGTV